MTGHERLPNHRTVVQKYCVFAPKGTKMPGGHPAEIFVYSSSPWRAIETAVAFWTKERAVTVDAQQCVALLAKE